MKSYEEVMEILEAFDLTRSFRSAGELAGCSHHTVEDWVAKRDRGELPVPGEVVERPKLIDPGIALTLVVAALLSLASFGRSFGHELVRAAATQLAEDLSAFVVCVRNIGREVLVGPVAAVVRLARMLGGGCARRWLGGRRGGGSVGRRSAIVRRCPDASRRHVGGVPGPGSKPGWPVSAGG